VHVIFDCYYKENLLVAVDISTWVIIWTL